jgi:hypothetical protein
MTVYVIADIKVMIRQKTTHLVQLCSSRTIGCHFEDDCGATETRKCFALA